MCALNVAITLFRKAEVMRNWQRLAPRAAAMNYQFRYNDLLVLARDEVIAISSLGEALRILLNCGYWKGDPILYQHYIETVHDGRIVSM